jgi:hypothetical protein
VGHTVLVCDDAIFMRTMIVARDLNARHGHEPDAGISRGPREEGRDLLANQRGDALGTVAGPSGHR